MKNMTDKEICEFCYSAIKTLEEEKKDEVMKCVGAFVLNPKIEKINEKITHFQKQCKHLKIDSNGKCTYCHKQLENKKRGEII